MPTIFFIVNIKRNKIASKNLNLLADKLSKLQDFNNMNSELNKSYFSKINAWRKQF